MLRLLVDSVYQVLRAVVNFGSPAESARNIDEVCRSLRLLDLDISDSEAVSRACIYILDPHNVPEPVGNTAKSNESGKGSEMSRLVNESSELQRIFSRKASGDVEHPESGHQSDMDISSGSDSHCEGTLQNHFQNTSKSQSKQSDHSGARYSPSHWKPNDMSSSSPAHPGSNNSNSSTVTEGIFRRQSTGGDTSNSCNSTPNSSQRKRRITDHNGDISSAQQFHSDSFTASTPLSSKSDPGRWRRFAMLNSSAKAKVRQSTERALRALNFSSSSSESSNSPSTATVKDETPKREQGAIAKHIARIRTSSSKNGSSKETSPNSNGTRYYSMRTSFTSSNKSSNSSLTLSP